MENLEIYCIELSFISFIQLTKVQSPISNLRRQLACLMIDIKRVLRPRIRVILKSYSYMFLSQSRKTTGLIGPTVCKCRIVYIWLKYSFDILLCFKMRCPIVTSLFCLLFQYMRKSVHAIKYYLNAYFKNIIEYRMICQSAHLLSKT